MYLFNKIINSIKEKIEELYYRRYYIIDHKRALKRIKILYRYIKRGFNTQDWDYQYGLNEFLDKLLIMADTIEKNNFRVNSKETATDIRKAVKLIQTSLDDDYYENKYELPIIKKYGHVVRYTARRDGFGNDKAAIFKNKHVGCSMISMREKENHSNYKAIKKAEKAAYAKAQKDRDRDWNEGWNLVRDNIQSWWD